MSQKTEIAWVKKTIGAVITAAGAGERGVRLRHCGKYRE